MYSFSLFVWQTLLAKPKQKLGVNKISAPNSVQIKLEFKINFLFCLFSPIALDRLSYGLFSTQCNVGTFFVLLSRLSNPKAKLSF